MTSSSRTDSMRQPGQADIWRAARDGVISASSSPTNTYGGTNSTEDGLPRKKIKKALSCDPCRRRKLKCDRGYPCGACRDRNDEANCIWEEGTAPQSAGRDGKSLAEVTQRLSRLESLMERVVDAVESRPDAHAQPAQVPSLPGSSFFGLSTESTDDSNLRVCIAQIHRLLPDPILTSRFCDVFSQDFDWFRNSLDRGSLARHAEIVAALGAGSVMPALAHLGRQELISILISEITLCAAFGNSAIYSKNGAQPSESATDSISVHKKFMHAALSGIQHFDVLENPTMDVLLVLEMLITGVSAVRSPVPGIILHQFAVQVARSLHLEQEPPEQLPYTEKIKRLEQYSVLCIVDWFFFANYRAPGTVVEDANKLPSLFIKEKRPAGLNTSLMIMFDISRLYLRISRALESFDEVLDIHREMLELRKEVEHYLTGVEVSRMTVHMRNLFITKSYSLLDYLALRLHLRFYMRGWDDAKYRLSRDTCYVSAKNLLHFFRLAFSWSLPEAFEDEPQIPPDHQNTIACIWNFCHWSIAASLLLMKHISTVTHRGDAYYSQSECDNILRDLCVMSRLLNALQPHVTVARDGYIAMQRVAGSAVGASGEKYSTDNLVPLWAQHITVEQKKKSRNAQASVSPSGAETQLLTNPDPVLTNLFDSMNDMDTIWTRFSMNTSPVTSVASTGGSQTGSTATTTPEHPEATALLNMQLALLQRDASDTPVGLSYGSLVPVQNDFLETLDPGVPQIGTSTPVVPHNPLWL